jgi:AcrR family transcriptional regulator
VPDENECKSQEHPFGAKSVSLCQVVTQRQLKNNQYRYRADESERRDFRRFRGFRPIGLHARVARRHPLFFLKVNKAALFVGAGSRQRLLTVTIVTCNDRFMSSRKDELRVAALNYLLEHGVANVSLRPMAAQLGTSARILMFHFNSKEGLLQEVLQELHSRLQSSFSRMSSDKSSARRFAPLKRFWNWATKKQNFPYLQLFYEVQIVAAQNPAEYRRYLTKVSLDWQAIAMQALSESVRSEAMSTLCIAVFDGLLLEMINTGDRARLTRALDHFIAMASASKRPGRLQGK